ncbi:hypothetical protein [Blastochloris tepida]|uniref:hypothetical protein n=1 Tax=Blastochloris tepida TaxID=2233851 RepID=UPI000F830770|nr:hypothetical protein [Blastochloris tepida]
MAAAVDLAIVAGAIALMWRYRARIGAAAVYTAALALNAVRDWRSAADRAAEIIRQRADALREKGGGSI